MLSFQHGELLPENQILQQKGAASMETAESSCQKEPNCAKHWVVLSQRHCEFQLAILLNPKADGVLARDNLQNFAEKTLTRYSFRYSAS